MYLPDDEKKLVASLTIASNKKAELEAIANGNLDKARELRTNTNKLQQEIRAQEDAATIASGFQPLTASERYINGMFNGTGTMKIKPRPLSESPSHIQSQVNGGTPIRTQSEALHTPTMKEIIAQANRSDPTAPHFDTSSDHMVKIDPLAEHIIYSGEGVKTINPLKPGPKISGLG